MRAQPGLRQERQVPLLHRQHRHRPARLRLRHVQLPAPPDAQRLRRGLEEDRPVAARPRKRRRESRRREEALRRQERESRARREQKKADRGATAARRSPKPGDKKEPPKVTIDFDDISQRILALPIPDPELRRSGGGQGEHALHLRIPPTRRRHGRDAAQVRSGKAQARQGARRTSTASSSRPTARRCSTASSRTGSSLPPRHRHARVQARRGQDQDRRHGGLRRPDAPSGSRCTARPGASSATSSTTRTIHGLDLQGHGEEVRAVPGFARAPRRPELPLPGDARRIVGRPSLRAGRRHARSEARAGRIARRRLQGRERALPLRQNLQRRELEPELRAPLTQPGVNVKAGEYLLAVKGRNLTANDNIYSFFESTANKQVVIKVGPNPDGAGSREVTVVPVPERGRAAQSGLDRREPPQGGQDDRRQAGLRLPARHCAGAATPIFNRYYFCAARQTGGGRRRAFNGGGQAADYIIDYLRKPLISYWAVRDGEDFRQPFGAMPGPKAMIDQRVCRQSGGDYHAVDVPPRADRPADRQSAPGAGWSASAATRS